MMVSMSEVDNMGRPMEEAVDPVAKIRQCYPDIESELDDDLEYIFQSARTVTVPAAVRLFHESEPCHMMMWLLEGSVRVYKHSPEGREITLYRVQPGDFCVLSLQCLFSGGGFPAEAESEAPLSGVMLTRQAIDEAIDRSPTFRRYILGLLSQRMSEMIHLISEISFNRLDLRLACLLGQLFERSGGAPLKTTHIQLAREIGTTREMVSRILKDFENKGCIRLRRGEIHLLSEQELQWFSRSA